MSEKKDKWSDNEVFSPMFGRDASRVVAGKKNYLEQENVVIVPKDERCIDEKKEDKQESLKENLTHHEAPVAKDVQGNVAIDSKFEEKPLPTRSSENRHQAKTESKSETLDSKSVLNEFINQEINYRKKAFRKINEIRGEGMSEQMEKTQEFLFRPRKNHKSIMIDDDLLTAELEFKQSRVFGRKDKEIDRYDYDETISEEYVEHGEDYYRSFNSLYDPERSNDGREPEEQTEKEAYYAQKVHNYYNNRNPYLKRSMALRERNEQESRNRHNQKDEDDED